MSRRPALAPALHEVRRTVGRGLSGLRSAPYVRKWIVLGVVIGVVAGLGAVVFYEGLELATRLLLEGLGGYTPAGTAGEGGVHAASRFTRPWAIPLVVALGALAGGLLVFRFAPEAEGHGTDAAIKAVHTDPKGVRPRVILVKLVASVLTIGSGGSGGREGPTAQISSGFGSVLARTLNLTPADSRICVSAGIAAGIGAVFRAPFGGALLGAELLYVHDMEVEAIMPSLIATVVGYGVFGGITGNFSPVFGDHSWLRVEHAWQLALYVLVGLVCGLAGRAYTTVFYRAADWFSGWRMPRAVRPAVGGLAVGLLGLLVPGALGTGYGTLQGLMDRPHLLALPLGIVLAIPLAKIAATSLSIGSGGSGGIFGPGMVIGGSAGALVWRLLDLAGLAPHMPAGFVIVGMAACFAAIAHAPIGVLLMVAEMTGSLDLLPPAMVAITFAMLVVGDLTIFRSQLASRAESAAHRFALARPEGEGVAVTRFMSEPPLVLGTRTPVLEALAALRGAGLAAAPVLNREGGFVGALRTDVLERASAQGDEGTVGRLASAEVMTLPASAGLDAAIDALPSSRSGFVPVLDDDMRLLGVVSTADVVRGWRQEVRASVRHLAERRSDTRLVEAVVAPGSPVAGRRIGDTGLPHGCVVVATARDGRLAFPTREQVIEVGDTLSVLSRPRHVATVERMLGGPASETGFDDPGSDDGRPEGPAGPGGGAGA